MVKRKSTKLPIAWSPKLPKRYKHNAMVGDLHRSKRISMNFTDELTDYLLRFVDSIIRNLYSTTDAEDPFIISPSLFDEHKRFILTDIPVCEKNENKSKNITKKFHHYPSGKYRVSINWITKKVKRLFPFKDKNFYPGCKIYHGLCFFYEYYIGESKRNLATTIPNKISGTK